MHYRFSGLVSCENDARQICRLLENLNPKPIGCGFTEIDLTKKIWEVDAYFNYVINSSIIYLLEKLYSVKFQFNEIRYNDWIAKVERKLTPISLQKVFIHGTHHRNKVSLNKINIEIQAAMAFGTGHHSTTKLCITIYLDLIKKGYVFKNILDVGCGTGILSIAASKISKARITSLDNDKIAVETAKFNLIKNQATLNSKVFRSEGLKNIHLIRFSKFDLVFANILFNPLKTLVKYFHKFLIKDGLIILSGISVQQAIKIEAIYLGHNLKKVYCINEENWMTLVMKKF